MENDPVFQELHKRALEVAETARLEVLACRASIACTRQQLDDTQALINDTRRRIVEAYQALGAIAARVDFPPESPLNVRLRT